MYFPSTLEGTLSSNNELTKAIGTSVFSSPLYFVEMPHLFMSCERLDTIKLAYRSARSITALHIATYTETTIGTLSLALESLLLSILLTWNRQFTCTTDSPCACYCRHFRAFLLPTVVLEGSAWYSPLLDTPILFALSLVYNIPVRELWPTFQCLY